MTRKMSRTTPLLSIAEVAERLQVSGKTVGRWIKSQELVAHKLGHLWRISEADLAAFLVIRRS